MLMIDVRIALKSLRATRVRTALTILGIVIGVAAITVVLSLGEGANATIRDQIKQMGNDLLTVRSGKGTRNAQGNLVDYNFWAALGSSTIGEYDLKTIQDTRGVKAASPIMAITGSIRTDPGDEPLKNTNIIATNVDLDRVAGLKVHSGSFLDGTADRNTVVLGSDLAIQMLGSDTAIGHTVYLRGEPFTVIGILSKHNAPTNLSDLYDYNRTAFIPMDAGKAFNQGVAQIQQINLRATSASDVQTTASHVQSAILHNHGGEDDFVVLRPEESLTLTNNILRIATQFSSAIASISLLVGGIGIMNIMLVSVTERTREIGIRKAVGATNAQVLRQFMIEALVMSVAGGLIGIVLAYGAAWIIGNFFHTMPLITWSIFGIAMLVAVGVGIIFGITPALKASRKDPIEALRQIQ
jgi:ABC-type antimicrobial peptide transport system permease subunit